MSASDLDEFMVHTATVEKALGRSGAGAALFAKPVTIPCFAEGKRRLVRAGTGEEVVSETGLYTYPEYESLFVPGSRVAVGYRTPSRVITVNGNRLSDDFPEHVEVRLE